MKLGGRREEAHEESGQKGKAQEESGENEEAQEESEEKVKAQEKFEEFGIEKEMGYFAEALGEFEWEDILDVISKEESDLDVVKL